MGKKIIIFALMLFIICGVDYVSAANICTKEKYNDLKEKASKIEMKWNLEFDEKNDYYFSVNAYNVDKDLMLILNNNVYEPNDDGIIILSTPFDGGKKYEFKFYGAYYHPCVEEYVYSRFLEIPKYNIYSKMDECSEYSEWELCDEWYQGSIEDVEDFYNKLNTYKEQIENGEIVLKSDKENQKINFIFLIILIIILATICFLIIRNKKIKKVKKR